MKMQIALLLLEAFQVAFLWIHDWVPLGRLNDVAAARRQDGTSRLVAITLIQSVPYTLGLGFTAHFLGGHWPGWVRNWLWISYGLLLVGQLRAWWVPYLLQPDPVRAERYRILFGRTHTFLPVRNGMVPNTAHILLHVATLATLIVLAMTAR